MSEPPFTVHCALCGEPFSSKEPLPEHAVCPRCKGEGGLPGAGPARTVDLKKRDKDRKKAKKAKKARRKNRKR